ncbi:MAG: ATP-binding cassette domain-containing protein [Nitrospirae bacterium]|nr:ATP-binding cassette domain-containing protein [Nitrospirota bacterium]
MKRPHGRPYFQFIEVDFCHSPMHNGSDNLVIKKVNLEIREGEWISIVGKSGSGKTTLTRLLCGLLSASKGEILIEGTNIEELKKRGELYRKVGYLFSNPENQIVYPIVDDDVSFGPANLGLPNDQMKTSVEEALRMVGLKGYEKKAVTLLSSGEMKKVALAGILAMNPKVLILDEPFLMMDQKGVLEMVDILKMLRGQGITLVSTMSSLEEAAFSDRIFIIKEGEIILEGGFREIISKREVIENAGLNIPKMTRLIYRLREGGMQIPVEVLDADEIADYLLNSINMKS